MIKSALILLLLPLINLSCGKDPSGIPQVPVNFHISLDHPNMAPLNIPNGSVVIDRHGVAGLIIYRSAFGGYMAYDRCSSVNPEQKCKVEVDKNGLTATDPCSKSIFSLEDGTPQKAPATMPLKQYAVSVSGRTIAVTN